MDRCEFTRRGGWSTEPSAIARGAWLEAKRCAEQNKGLTLDGSVWGAWPTALPRSFVDSRRMRRLKAEPRDTSAECGLRAGTQESERTEQAVQGCGPRAPGELRGEAWVACRASHTSSKALLKAGQSRSVESSTRLSIIGPEVGHLRPASRRSAAARVRRYILRFWRALTSSLQFQRAAAIGRSGAAAKALSSGWRTPHRPLVAARNAVSHRPRHLAARTSAGSTAMHRRGEQMLRLVHSIP